MQAMHMMWSVGSTISPLLAEPFLVEAAPTNATHCQPQNSTDSDEESWSDLSNTTTDYGACDRDITYVRYAFVLIGSIVLLIGFVYVVLYCALGHHLFRVERFVTREKTPIREQEQPRCFKFGFYVLLFVFFLFLDVCEVVGGKYLAVFTVEELGWTVKSGALITLTFWAAHGIGRLIGVFTSFIISSRGMLYMALVLLCIGYITLLFAHVMGEIGVYVAIMIAGLGNATIFPSMLLWSSSVLSSSNAVSSVCLISSCLGIAAGYVIIGGLMDLLGYMSYVYSMVTCSVLALVTFIIMQVYAVASRPKKNANVTDELYVF